QVAVEFVNAELGGVGGRPLELVDCPTSGAEETQACGTELVNESDVRMIVLGENVLGGIDAVLSAAAATDKAVISSEPTAPEQITRPNAALAFLGGGSAQYNALVEPILSGELGDIHDVAFVYVDTPNALAVG